DRVRRKLGLGGRPGELGGGDDLELDRDAQLGRQARRRGAAEALERAAEPPLLIARELRRPREVHRAQARRAPLGGGWRIVVQVALLGGLDEGGDLLWGQGLAHARTPGMSSISAPPASLLSTAPPGKTRIVRPRAPPVAEATTGMRSVASAARTADSLRTPMSSALPAPPPPSANICAPPTSTARRAVRDVPSADVRATSSGTARSAN